MQFEQLQTEASTVRCEPSGNEARVGHDGNLMDAIRQAGLTLTEPCDGVMLCGFCRVKVLEGYDNLTSAEAEERKVLTALRSQDNERLACRARVKGPVTVTTDYW